MVIRQNYMKFPPTPRQHLPAFFSLALSFNQSSRSLMLPSLLARCQTLSIDVGVAIITKSIRRCQRAPAFSPGHRFLRSTPLRYVRLFLQSEKENNLYKRKLNRNIKQLSSLSTGRLISETFNSSTAASIANRQMFWFSSVSVHTHT